MRSRIPMGGLLLVAFLAQGCMTTGGKKMAAKKKKIPPRQSESFALMDDAADVDQEILMRGNKARGLTEY